jgi:hypothetical protein
VLGRDLPTTAEEYLFGQILQFGQRFPARVDANLRPKLIATHSFVKNE